MYRLMHLNGSYEINLDAKFIDNRKIIVGRGRGNCDVSIDSVSRLPYELGRETLGSLLALTKKFIFSNYLI